MIRFKCHKCQAGIRTEDNRAGTKATCPQCKTPLTVPDEAILLTEELETVAAAPPPLPPLPPPSPAITLPSAEIKERPVGFCCPFCKSDVRPLEQSCLNAGGWVFVGLSVFVLLVTIALQIGCPGLSVAAVLFMCSWFARRTYHTCVDCKLRLD